MDTKHAGVDGRLHTFHPVKVGTRGTSFERSSEAFLTSGFSFSGAFRKKSRRYDPRVGPAKKGSQNLNLKLLEMLAISQFKARFQARNQF